MSATNGSKFLTAYHAFVETRAAAREWQSKIASLEAKREPTEAAVAEMIAEADAERARAGAEAQALRKKLETEISEARSAYDVKRKQSRMKAGGLDELLYAELRNE